MGKYSSCISKVGVLHELVEKSSDRPVEIFEFHWLDGKVEKFPGVSVSDAFEKAGYGLGAIPALNFYVKLPTGSDAPEVPEPLYQVFSMKTSKENWEPVGGFFNGLELANATMDLEVDRFGRFSSLVVDVNSDKILSWKWR